MTAVGIEKFVGTWEESAITQLLFENIEGLKIPARLEWKVLVDGTIVGTLKGISNTKNGTVDEVWLVNGKMNTVGTCSATFDCLAGLNKGVKATAFWRMPVADHLLDADHQGFPIVINLVSDLGTGRVVLERNAAKR